MQNAAAAEQHLRDMADYEAKLAEAAQAWEADRKKKKGKAKEEVRVQQQGCAGHVPLPGCMHGWCLRRSVLLNLKHGKQLLRGWMCNLGNGCHMYASCVAGYYSLPLPSSLHFFPFVSFF